MTKFVLYYELDKVRYLDLETYLIPVLFSQIKRLMVEIELNVMEWKRVFNYCQTSVLSINGG